MCPFCFQSFKAISRHKCKIAPINFTFQKEICHDEFFYSLYHKSVAFNKKSGHIDVVKLDRNPYQYSFVKLYLRLKNDPKLSIEAAAIDENFDDEEQIREVISTKKELIEKTFNLASSKRTKLVQLCPHCGLKYRRLYSHKCRDSPLFTFHCGIHPDEFFDLVYKASGIWDPRGFLNLYRFDLKRYRSNFLQAIKSLEETDVPSVKVLEQLLVIPEEVKTTPRQKTDLEKLEEEISSNLKQSSHSDQKRSSLPSQNVNISPISLKKSDLKEICPFCFESFNSLYGHDCELKPSDIEFTQSLGDDIDFFKRLYREIGALNKYGKIDFNKFSQTRYSRLFTKYFQPPYLEEEKFKDYKQRILHERHKVAEEQRKILEEKKLKNLQLQEKQAQKTLEDERSNLLKLQQMKQICPFCFKSTPSLSQHTCTKLPPEFSYSPLLSQVTFFKDLYKNSNGLNRKGHIDQYRLNRRKYLQMFIRIHDRLQETKDSHLNLEYHETRDVPIIYDLTPFYSSLKQKVGKIENIIEEERITIDQKAVPQICPYCYTLHECLFGHSCDKTPSGFKFDVQLFSAEFFGKIYKKIGSMSNGEVLNFFIFDRSEYTSQFSYEYKKFLSSLSNKQVDRKELESAIISVPEVKDDVLANKHPTRVSKEIVVEQKLLLLDSLKVKNYRVKQICPYCFISLVDLSKHKCLKLPENVSELFQFDEKACLSDLFLYLYHSVKAWQKKGFVDENKLNRNDYTTLFFQCYNILVTQEKPSLKETFEDIYDNELAEEITQKQQIIELSEESVGSTQATAIRGKKQHYKFKHICPYCLELTDVLFTHECQNLPSELAEGYRFTEIPYADDFFESLYSKAGALNRFGKLDQYRLNRTKYTSQFLTKYQALQENLTLEAKNLALENKPELQDESSTIEGLNIEVDDEYSDMDLLELLSRDIDINGGDSQPTISSELKTMHESSDGMPLCFSCKKMVDCPKGLDSSQMESCMRCDEYLNMSPDSESDQTADDESGMPLCFSCSNMIDCPRGIDSNQMETVFSCKEFRDMNSPEKEPEEIPPLCFSCSNMVNCPRGIDSAQMENIFDCKHYQDMNSSVPSPQTTFDSMSNSSLPQKEKNSSSEEDLLSSILSRRSEDRETEEKLKLQEEDEKQKRIAEIMQEWEKSKGELKVFCKKCEAEMSKVVTQKKVYYQCNNYPECLIRGDEWYVKKATEKRVITQKIQGDLIKIYQFDETKNIVFISEIYSEGKLFL